MTTTKLAVEPTPRALPAASIGAVALSIGHLIVDRLTIRESASPPA
jgi:hypothetical protein